MAYFGQSQMSKAPNALDYLKKKEEEKKKFNLFDFSDVTPKPQLNFGPGMSGPGITNFQDFKANIPQQAPQTQPTQKSGFSLFPTANANQETQTNQPVFGSKTKGRGPTNLFINERQALDKMINAGVNEEQALKAIAEKRIELWGSTRLTPQESNALIQMAKADVDINQAIKAVKEKRYDDATILQKIGKNVLDLGAAGGALVAEQILNAGSFIFNDDELKQQAEAIRKIRKEDFESTIGGKAGSFITGAGEAIAVGPTKIAPTLLGRTAQGAMVGGVIGGATPVLEQGNEATMGDIATGGVIGGTIGAVATPLLEKVAAPLVVGAVKGGKNAVLGTAQQTKKYVTALNKGGTEGLSKSVTRDFNKLTDSLRKGTTVPINNSTTREIPRAIVKRDLGFTPTERAKIEQIVGTTEADYILKKGLAGKGKEELAEIFAKQADDMYNGISKSLKGVEAPPIKSNVATEALEDILDQLTSNTKIARAYAKDIEGVKNMLQKGEYTLDDLNNIRRAYDKVNTGIYTAKGQIKSGLESQIDAKVRRELNSLLQKEAKKYGIDIKAMNTELRAGIEMKDALLRRLSQEERNNFIGLQDLGVSAILSGGNPATAIAAIGAKKYGEKVAPSLAQKLYNLNKSTDVTRRMSRGNPVINRSKSTGLGLSSSSRNNMADSSKITATPLKPSIDKEKKLLKPNQPTNVSNKTIIKPKKTGGEVLKTKVDKVAEKTGAKTNLLPTNSKQVSKVSDDLISEARKYKSVEEFVDNNIADIYGDKFFHGSTINIPEIKVLNQGGELGQGFYITNNATLAKDFVEKQLGKQKTVVNKIGMKGVKMKFMTKRDYVSEVRKYNNSEDFRKDIINEGYDGIWSPDTNQGVIFPEKVKKLKTEAQLKQIYEQSKKTKLIKKAEPKGSDDLKPITKLNTGEKIVLVRGEQEGGKTMGYGIKGEGQYLTDNIDVAKHYGGNLKYVSIKNSKILDGDKIITKNYVREITKELPNNIKRNFGEYDIENMDYTYNSLIRDLSANSGIDEAIVSNEINKILKNKYNGIKYKIGDVNDALYEKGLGDKNAFIIFPQANKPKPLKKAK